MLLSHAQTEASPESRHFRSHERQPALFVGSCVCIFPSSTQTPRSLVSYHFDETVTVVFLRVLSGDFFFFSVASLIDC